MKNNRIENRALLRITSSSRAQVWGAIDMAQTWRVVNLNRCAALTAGAEACVTPFDLAQINAG